MQSNHLSDFWSVDTEQKKNSKGYGQTGPRCTLENYFPLTLTCRCIIKGLLKSMWCKDDAMHELN